MIAATKRTILALSCALVTFAALAPAAEAAPAPAFSLSAAPQPASFVPGRESIFFVAATNVGAAPTSAPTVIEASLPLTMSAIGAAAPEFGGISPTCSVAAHLVRCETGGAIPPGRLFEAKIFLIAEAAPPAPISVSVSGGGAGEQSATVTPQIGAAEPPFSILPPGLRAPLTEDDGSPATIAASHPYQQTVSFQFPTFDPPGAGVALHELTAAGHPRDILVDLPPGLIGDPAASPVLCTEAELLAEECPAASAVGVINVNTVNGGPNNSAILTSSLFDMVPPPGHPAELSTNIGGVGIYVHLLASLRSDSNYGIEVSTPDVIAFGTLPIFGIQTQVWGDPSSPAHDRLRGSCVLSKESCPVASQKTAFWALPARCDAQPDISAMRVDSWEQPGSFLSSAYGSADLAGNPVSLSGCNAIQYAPTVEARPTTNLADSPSGLDFHLHQPQDMNKEHRASGELREARVTLPAGMVVNPSQADGRAVCSEAQIGYLAESEDAGIHFSRDPQSCTDASKLGTAEVTSPLLPMRNAEHKLELDPETEEPIPTPLHGSVYLAQPFHNPFGSLLAIYLVIEDPETGIVSKLAGKVEADPQTGQLTNVFEENPQLPIEDISLHLFGGARAPLITPPTCGTHTTTTDLVPWSAPEGEDAHPTSSFQTTTEPGGGVCPGQEAEAPNAPSFRAGTLSPQAAAYSPFVLKLSREDGSQRISKIDTTLAPGLTGKLAGIAECSEGQVAQARAREHPEEGILERQSPSCPASSEVGKVIVAAGAGPTPFYATGHAYLAGPYAGAPLSLAVIVPAIAGPFDLGAVVSRVALHVDPQSAQIHAVSDPLPQILDGIPLDVRSIALTMDRPDFTLNPTSCDPMTIAGSATSAFGLSAPLSTPFQVGGCSALPYKPTLTLKLKGRTKRSGNPAVKAVLTQPANQANTAGATVILPSSEFIDQSHINNPCTRVQFNEGACPAGSILGTARAITPLLDQPLEGPIYFRSNGGERELPDIVADLHGQIHIALVGFIDSVQKKGTEISRVRTRFQNVPDAPVTKFTLGFYGGKRGLLENHVNLCAATNKATATFIAQNGKLLQSRPVVRALGCKGKKGHGGKKHRAADHPVR